MSAPKKVRKPAPAITAEPVTPSRAPKGWTPVRNEENGFFDWFCNEEHYVEYEDDYCVDADGVMYSRLANLIGTKLAPPGLERVAYTMYYELDHENGGDGVVWEEPFFSVPSLRTHCFLLPHEEDHLRAFEDEAIENHAVDHRFPVFTTSPRLH